VARNFIETPKKRRRSAIDERTTRHPGYAASQRARKRVEEVFGWMKTAAGLRQTHICNSHVTSADPAAVDRPVCVIVKRLRAIT